MNVNILALVPIISLVCCVLVLGLEKAGKATHHDSRIQGRRPSVKRNEDNLSTTVKVRELKRPFGKEKTIMRPKGALLATRNEKEIAENEFLATELALASAILGDKRSTIKTWNKKYDSQKRKTPKEKTVKIDDMTDSSILRDVSQKRASISSPLLTNDRDLPEDEDPKSRTLLTAIGLLFNKRNHFEKDSNALTLAKVLLDGDQSLSTNKINRDSSSYSTESHLGDLSNLLRFLNASLSQKSLRGERKSTIHTELVNPTELGVSILRLLFGHKAHLVMKPVSKDMLHNIPDLLYDSEVSSSRMRLLTEMKQFNQKKGRRKHHRRSFSFALAKAISEVIKAMAKEDLKNYFRQMQTRPKQSQLARIPDRFWPSKKKVDVQGNRKSWVLLKIPKSGEEMIPQQTMADEPLQQHEEETEVDKASAGIVDTLGKLALDPNERNTETSSNNGINKAPQKNPVQEIKTRPTARVGYSVRILPSLQGSTGKQAESSLQTNVAKPLSNEQTTQAFAEAVQKLLRAVQSSIQTLQGKQVIRHLPNLSSVISNQPQNSANDHITTIVSDQPGTTGKTNTGTVRGMRTKAMAMDNLQLNEKQPILPKKPSSLEKVPAFTRATGQSEPLARENTILDPWKDLEPITKSISPPKKLGPSGNVLFESATELGVPRGPNDRNTVNHIQEDLESFAEKALQAHNHYRDEHHASRLRWSDELATQAEKLAYDMAMKGMVERSEVATAMGYGENVAKITGVPFNDAGSVATDIWYSESSNYSYSYPRVTPQTDAFTQLVWRETAEIGMGCAKDIATNDLYVVALYKPPGNNRRRLRENVMNKGLMTEDVYATIFKRTQ
ncbi:uncharacterized protein [Montipora foliosa]|uniref:uncharacterized protein n=1 Tax=Montipora foliosa TaxID=591990 RepID=UPI0035F1E657